MLTCPQTGVPAIVVLGIGNLLWADEGFGVRCIEALEQHFEFAPHVSLIDGGTQGLCLVQYVQAADSLLIFDAVDYGLAPGTLKIVEDDDVPAFLGVRKMSLHQTGFQEVLMLARLTGRYPRRVLLIGCQPDEVADFGGSLRPAIKASLERALELGLERLAAWGGEPTPRHTPLNADDAVTLPHLALSRYEGERPSEADACRTGDVRVLLRMRREEPPSCV
ncbi:hydrogenase maturation protease [Paraburkholderia atlantica]|uniref:Hydrogenase maturation protease n=2 Tax=Paraburkholderia TaxID=1822464 RepID=A0A7W8LDI3_9BURK|nr:MULTISPECIES: HyaD/HybD family hydrogenase maturation endopeptidase [Paraburkholderia]MBB5405034.1 hydrogenase maturation protease [Paraburkholderia youngii]MBB5420339.1 hydrogenase maturation protease [Paraburkholderia atlantica]MBB5429308.1 hydrogenase maturation protease [Paraburkholderia atlantica]MPW10805.1 HyaD/HybD family hydrogenase maturation endopeptidase [Paraburkholderia atlantica]NUY35553.1 HyaD/HybD family hydrogenase maturation endopeptidase [Paraburkholderia atlantica]